MKRFILLALPMILLGTSALAQACDPRQASCAPGQWVDLSHDQGAVCHACTGNTVSNGCSQYCSKCGAGTMTNSGHTQCNPIPLCPSPLKGSHIPANNWSTSSTASGYYAPDSAIINTSNSHVVVGSASRATVKSYMGSGFGNANFNVVGGAGTTSGLGPNVIQCPYDGPRFTNAGRPLQATVTINCTGTCAGL